MVKIRAVVASVGRVGQGYWLERDMKISARLKETFCL